MPQMNLSRRAGGRPDIGFDASWYYATRNPTAERRKLEADVEADVCVIGAGYTGLSPALTLV